MITRFQLLQPQTALSRWREGRAIKRERKSLAVLAMTNPRTLPVAGRSERRAVHRAIEFLSLRRPAAVSNWYESGFPLLDGTRSCLPSIIQDARYDQNMVTRREMMRRMRYWSQNSDILKSALDVSRQYTIGSHMPVVTSLASDSDWGQIAEQVFHELTSKCGVDGESLFSMLTVAHDCKKVDGDILFIETNRPGKYTIRHGTKYETQITKVLPALQMVEAHRIETPPSKWKDENRTVIDGVQYQVVEMKLDNGEKRLVLQKIGYWVKDSLGMISSDESYSLIPIESAIHVFTPHRVSQVRGLSDFYAVEPTLALLEDLLKMEMRAQEVLSDIVLFITNGAGQVVDPKMQATLGAMQIKLQKDGQGNPIVTADDVTKAREVYKKVWGGQIAVGRSGDTMTPMAPNRPAEATLNLWNFLIDSFCSGSKSPRVLTFPKSNKGQGTEVRAELDKANTGWTTEFNLTWKPVMTRAWEFFIGWAIQNDSRLKNPPPDWRNIEVSSPRSVLVDAGYDSASMLAEMAAGINPLHFIAQRLGTTRQKLIDASVSDLVLIKKACNKASKRPDAPIEIKPEEIRQSLSEVIKNLAAMETARAQQKTKEAELQIQNA